MYASPGTAELEPCYCKISIRKVGVCMCVSDAMEITSMAAVVCYHVLTPAILQCLECEGVEIIGAK